MGTKEKPGAYDCYANAEPDEPMFVLLGRDKHAPALVWLWAVLREIDQENPAIVEEARTCAAEMMHWAVTHDRQSAGLGVALIAAAMELIRWANTLVKDAPNAHTDLEFVRRLLCTTKFEDGPTNQEESAK